MCESVSGHVHCMHWKPPGTGVTGVASHHVSAGKSPDPLQGQHGIILLAPFLELLYSLETKFEFLNVSTEHVAEHVEHR